MLEASDNLEFERAGALETDSKLLKRFTKVKTWWIGSEELDVWAAYGGEEAWVEIFFIRQGKLIGRDHFTMSGTREEEGEEILGRFIEQFYSSASHVPRKILVPESNTDKEMVADGLRLKAKGRLKSTCHSAEQNADSLNGTPNAAQGLEQLKLKWIRFHRWKLRCQSCKKNSISPDHLNGLSAMTFLTTRHKHRCEYVGFRMESLFRQTIDALRLKATMGTMICLNERSPFRRFKR
ncbi:MAG: hypothetical protein Ct9H300mP19_11000 [Dehalococcoidia bacterium]|nr:MAG: hypothetical protein Ct9H300mP19_11000 [Dehalococcoidia bacterium]